MFSQRRIAGRQPVQTIHLPSLPVQVHPNDLDEHLKLIPAEDIKRLQDTTFKKHYHKSKNVKTPFPICTFDDDIYALYKHTDGHGLDDGLVGRVQLAQNQSTGEWVACKKVYGKYFNEDEVMMHRLRGSAVPRKNPEKNTCFCIKSHKQGKRHLFFMRLEPGKNLWYNAGIINSLQALELVKNILEMTVSTLKAGFAPGDLHEGNLVYDPISQHAAFVDLDHWWTIPLEAIDKEQIENQVYLVDLLQKTIWLEDNTEEIRSILERYYLDIARMQHCIRAIEKLIPLVPETEKRLPIGILDVGKVNPTLDEIKSLSKNHEQNGYAEIWLIDTSPIERNLNDYLTHRHAIQAEDIPVGDKILRHPSKERLQYHLRSMLREHHQGHHCLLFDAITNQPLHTIMRTQKTLPSQPGLDENAQNDQNSHKAAPQPSR